MKEAGWMIKPTVKEHTSTQIRRSTLVSGKMISSMDMGWRSGQMERNTKENMKMGGKKEKESSTFTMDRIIRELFTRMIYMEKEDMSGQTEKRTKVNSSIIKCMVMDV